MVKNKAAVLFVAGLLLIAMACVFNSAHFMILGVAALLGAALCDSNKATTLTPNNLSDDELSKPSGFALDYMFNGFHKD